jgi:hypothetical protein
MRTPAQGLLAYASVNRISAMAGACMMERAMRTARTVSSPSISADRKLKLIWKRRSAPSHPL